MAKPKERANPILLQDGMEIGSGSAETDDDFLFDCFIKYPPVDACLEIKSHGMVLVGRTGAGKTAILRYINAQTDHCVSVDPAEIAMSYISNSDCLTFLTAVGADLDLIFQYLWKHVLCIEFIRLYWNVGDEQSSKNIFQRLTGLFGRDDRRRKALDYLKSWEGKFWITMDENIREITEKLEKDIKASLGAEVAEFKSDFSYVRNLSSDKRSEIIYRSKNIIKPGQLAELSGVIDMLADRALDDQKRFYILIDKLDERWVDASVRFRLIRSLLETLKTFRRIQNLKIIVALRVDVLEKVLQETRDITFQREKYEDYFIKIRWEKHLLRGLIEERIKSLFRRKYTGKDIIFADVFPNNVGSTAPFDYMIEKTLYRPRDVIAFVNQCLLEAHGHYEVTGHQIRRAEFEYSRIRREALEQEWESAFPTIRTLLKYVARRNRESFTVAQLCADDELQTVALEIADRTAFERDPVAKSATNYYEEPSPTNMIAFVREIIITLYRVGAIGAKLRSSERYRYSHINEPVLESATISEETQARVHPMLHMALNLHPKAIDYSRS